MICDDCGREIGDDGWCPVCDRVVPGMFILVVSAIALVFWFFGWPL